MKSMQLTNQVELATMHSGSWKRRIRSDTDTDTDTDTDIFKKDFYIYITVPNAVFTVVFASRPRRRSFHSAYPFINARAKD